MRLAVQGAWVADNLKRLGSGAFYHLSYSTHHVHPVVMKRLRSGPEKYGKIEIYIVRGETGFQIADGETVAVHWFPEFIRIHFMIGRVYMDELGPTMHWEDPDRLVLPRSR